MDPNRAVASYDSASAMLRALAAFLHGRGVPLIGGASGALEPLAIALLGATNQLPIGVREWLYKAVSGREGIPRRRVGGIDADALAEWVVSQYPVRQWPVVLIGAANGAAVHLAAAIGAPWLPQTLLVPVHQRGDPDDVIAAYHRGSAPGRALLSANPEIVLHQLHDPNQDRLTGSRIAYFRIKWFRLPAAYRTFVETTLAPGGTLLVVDCQQRWPVTQVGERHFFQHGAIGGLDPQQYAARWTAPPVDRDEPESEWGYGPELDADIHGLATSRGWRLRRLAFDHPDDLSPLVADLHRWWHTQRGLPADRLLVESFLLVEPFLAQRTASVPLWSTFATQDALNRTRAYLSDSDPFREILVTLFSHGVLSLGLASSHDWQHLLERATSLGALVGVDPAAFPRDLSTLARFHRELAAFRPTFPLPERLTLAEVDRFIASTRQNHAAWLVEDGEYAAGQGRSSQSERSQPTGQSPRQHGQQRRPLPPTEPTHSSSGQSPEGPGISPDAPRLSGPDGPVLPARIETTLRDLPLGRMRSRSVGAPQPGVPEFVLVQGMAVSDYLLPGLAAVATWTRAHLVDLPGLSGSGEPPQPLNVREYGQAVASWLDEAALGSVILAGHSSGTQVAAHTAALRKDDLTALVLASPTVDPVARSWPRLLLHWQLNGRREPGGLNKSHLPEWVRAGVRKLVHIVSIHLADPLEDVVPRLPMPVLILRGNRDRLLTAEWAQELTRLATDGRFEEVPGAHTFLWANPEAWADPIRRLT